MSSPLPMAIPGPPYSSPYALPGGIPTIIPDVPVTAVLLAIYLSFAVANMSLLQLNLRRSHKFLVSGALFGFCMSRVLTTILRILVATQPQNIRLSIAANVFVNAGVLILYVVNLLFAARILRARQPTLGWHPALRITLRVFFVAIGVALVLVIYSVVQGVYTLNRDILHAIRNIQLAASTFILVFTALPLVLLLLAYLLPRAADSESFGKGSEHVKALLTALASCLCITIAGFKAGVAWEPPRPASNPAWYHSRPAFYVFNFALEIVVLALYTILRVDRRFHVPDGSRAPGDYSKGQREVVVEKEEESGK